MAKHKVAKKNKKKEKEKNKKRRRKLRAVKSTLSKKKKKALDKELGKEIKNPALKEARSECNHAAGRDHQHYSVDDFKGLGYVGLNGKLQRYVEVYGEENVSVCRKCYIPMVPIEVIRSTEVSVENLDIALEAMATAINFEQKSTKKIKTIVKGSTESISDLTEIQRRFIKKYNKVADNDDYGTPSRSGGNDKLDFSKVGNN